MAKHFFAACVGSIVASVLTVLFAEVEIVEPQYLGPVILAFSMMFGSFIRSMDFPEGQFDAVIAAFITTTLIGIHAMVHEPSGEAGLAWFKGVCAAVAFCTPILWSCARLAASSHTAQRIFNS